MIRSPWLSLCVLLAAMPLSAKNSADALRQQGLLPTVVVTLVNNAHVAADTLRAARSEVERIYDLAGIHLGLRDRNGDPTGGQLDRGDAGRLGDGEGRVLARGDRRLASQQHADDRAVAGRDPILEEHVVLEPELLRLWERDARNRRRPLDVRHDADPRLLRDDRGRQRTDGHAHHRRCQGDSRSENHAFLPSEFRNLRR